MIDIDSVPIFRDNKATLKSRSLDNAEGEYMTESSIVATNFDDVKRIYTNCLGHSDHDAYSIDALLQSQEAVVFIEFKNGKNIENSIIRWKAYDSLIMFNDLTDSTVKDSRKSIDLIVVYNKEKQKTPSRTEIGKTIMSLSGEELILFNLERYKGLYFHDVHTYSQDEFESYLNRTTFLGQAV